MTSSPAVSGGASYSGRLATRGGFGTVRREGHLSGVSTRRPVFHGGVTATPVPWRVIACRFPSQALSPRVEATGNVGRRVDICLILSHPTLVVRTSERRLRRPRAEMTTGMARLARVCRAHFLYRDARVESFILDTAGETGKRPVVEPPVHPRPIVEILADIGQVFENNNWVLKRPGVLDGFAGGLLNDICQGVLVVAKSVIYPPLGGVTLLETTESCEHLFAEVSRSTTIVNVWLGWGTTIRQGTARQELGFTDVKTNWRRIVRLCRFCDFVLDGDVEHPAGGTVLQSELADCQVAVEQVVPQFPLSGVDAERNPESVATAGLRNAPAEPVLSLFRVIDLESPIRETNRVVFVQFLGVIRVQKFRDVIFQRVFRIRRKSISGDNIINSRLRIRPALERPKKSTTIRRHSTLKPTLFVRRRRRECGFKCFRDRSGHPTIPHTLRRFIRIYNTIFMNIKKHPSQDRGRPVRGIKWVQKPTRLLVEDSSPQGLPYTRHQREAVDGQPSVATFPTPSSRISCSQKDE